MMQMHIPSAKLHLELLSTPGFARFIKASGANGLETTLILKESTLTLKYLIRRAHFRVLIRQLRSGKLLYAVLIDDYDEKPVAAWSIVETEEEFRALTDLVHMQSFPLFLFNEACVNVCWANADFELLESLDSIIRYPMLFSSDVRNQEDSREAEDAIDSALSGSTPKITLQTTASLHWHEVKNHYVTNQLVASPIGILSEDEGDQQEELCTWLLDNLSPSGAYKGPQVQEVKKQRELTDVLINYPEGCFLVESKTLAIMERGELPPRTKLRKNVLKNIAKALSQLPGACRNILSGLKITSASGTEITINTKMPPHCIILVPELSLLQVEDNLGGDCLKSFMKQNKAYLHILDPNELMILMRAAGHMAYLGKKTSKMMAFDAVLIERWGKAIDIDTPNIRQMTHFV